MDLREHAEFLRSRTGGQPLLGQKALVTGANSGIGKAVALALADAGAAVAVNYVASEDDARAVADHIETVGGKAIALRADVSKEMQVEAMFAEAVEAFGTLDIVVCNAGLQRDAPFEELTLQQWNTVIDVNLTGQFLCARAAVREFLRRGRRAEVSRALGKIICMSSVHEVIPWAGHANYAASKGGVMMLMKTIAQELAPRGIRVNGLAPGATRTPINTAAWSTPEAYEALMRLVPYKRIGEPDDIARAAVWLASDDSDYVNGVTLFVDGGMTLYPEFASGG
jgi:glucose 1-dehydrogenase